MTWRRSLDLTRIHSCFLADLGLPVSVVDLIFFYVYIVQSTIISHTPSTPYTSVSMPGMMDTVLNIGLNDITVDGLAKATENDRFAWDSYRRLLDMFGEVVLGISHEDFEKRFDKVKEAANAKSDVDLGVEDLKKLCDEYKQVYLEEGKVFPMDPYEQLYACVKAVFGSWMTPRAVKYREINNIKNLIGTATNIQTMVFGNMGDDSGTGVAFSRNPSTGENLMYGEYLINAQGEDVVAGIRTPQPISQMQEVLPDAYAKFLENVDKLEHYFKDMQDVEFTVEKGKLWMLQCRNGKRTGVAAIRIATELVEEGICTKSEALLKVEPRHVEQLLHPTFSPEALKSAAYTEGIVAKGLPGSPGAAVGKLVFNPKQAEDERAKGESVILVRETTSPEDVGGMWAGEYRMMCSLCTMIVTLLYTSHLFPLSLIPSRWHFDRERRNDVSRRSGCSWMGQTLCLWML